MRQLRTFLLALSLLPGITTGAESMYVIDKLLVGVHRDRDLNSAIIKVLPTGSLLQVLERNDQLARVKDAEGVEGWVDAAYLMQEPPASMQLADARQERQMLLERIKQMEGRQASGASPAQADGGKVEDLTNENTELKSQLSSLKLKGSELEQQLKSRGGAAGDSSAAGELRKANLELTETLTSLRARNNELEAQLATDTALGRLRGTVSLGSPWMMLGLAVLIALSFGAGAFCVDYLNRRRHGGFRI
jgi:SH3 domain protein